MRDMTEGSPLRQIMRFAVPMLFASIFQQLYNLVDTLIVGRYLGADALAGVGATGTLTFLLLNFALGMANGGGLILSQCYGRKDKAQMRETILAMVWTMGILCLILSALGFVFARPLLLLLHVPEAVLAYALTYIRIILLFSASSMLYNGTAAILRSVGDSKTPLYALIVSSFMNIALDLLLVVVFPMGVAGAAVATVVSQFAAAAVGLHQIAAQREDFGLSKEYGRGLVPTRDHVVRVMKTSVPSSFQSCMISIGNLSVQRLINSFGVQTMAGYTAACKIDQLAIQVILSVGNALCVFTGQNIGAGRLDRVENGAKKGTLVAMATSAVITLLILLFGRYLMALFTDTDALIEQSYHMMMILGVGYIAMEVTQCLQGVMRGAGDTMAPMWLSMITTVVIRVPLAYLMTGMTKSAENPHGEFYMMFVSLLITWLIGATLTTIVYKAGRWKRKALI